MADIGWTFETLKEHFDERIDALTQQLDERQVEVHRRLEHANNAIAKAVEAKRDTDAAAIKVQENTVTKEMLAAELKSIESKINDLRDTRSKLGGKDEAIEQGKTNQRWIIGLGVTFMLFVIGQIIIVWSRR